MSYTLYLAGEIHSTWRDDLATALTARDLDVRLLSPVTDHAASDNVGTDILGPEDDNFWKDHKGAGINAIRTRHALRQADLVVVKFGDKYRQWNAAFDAGAAHALGKPLVILHPPELTHALKEVDVAANAVCETPEQVADIVAYVLR